MNKIEVQASENREITLIYEIVLFSSVTIRANFAHCIMGRASSPPCSRGETTRPPEDCLVPRDNSGTFK